MPGSGAKVAREPRQVEIEAAVQSQVKLSRVRRPVGLYGCTIWLMSLPMLPDATCGGWSPPHLIVCEPLGFVRPSVSARR